MAFKFSKLFARREEAPDPQPHNQNVKFKRQISLEERVQQAVRSEMMAARLRQLESEDKTGFDDIESTEFDSPHELVRDPVSGEEVTKAQLSSREAARREFDSYVTEVRKKKSASKKVAPVSDPVSEEVER